MSAYTVVAANVDLVNHHATVAFAGPNGVFVNIAQVPLPADHPQSQHDLQSVAVQHAKQALRELLKD